MKKALAALFLALIAVPATVRLYLTRIANDDGLSLRRQTLLQQPALPPDTEIAKLVVRKNAREMDAYDHSGRLLKTYPAALGRAPVGHKQFEGDGKTPEGRYTISGRNPHSGCHKNLGVSYPTTPTAPAPPRKAEAPAATSKSTASKTASAPSARNTCAATGPTAASP